MHDKPQTCHKQIADLELPLSWHYFTISASNLDSSVETRTIMGFQNISSEHSISTNRAIIRSCIITRCIQSNQARQNVYIGALGGSGFVNVYFLPLLPPLQSFLPFSFQFLTNTNTIYRPIRVVFTCYRVIVYIMLSSLGK